MAGAGALCLALIQDTDNPTYCHSCLAASGAGEPVCVCLQQLTDLSGKLLKLLPQYAERLPIGLESVIRHVDADTVKGFYQKWYRPERMAVVCIGDFADPDAVVATLKEALSSATAASSTPPPPLPKYSPSLGRIWLLYFTLLGVHVRAASPHRFLHSRTDILLHMSWVLPLQPYSCQGLPEM